MGQELRRRELRGPARGGLWSARQRVTASEDGRSDARLLHLLDAPILLWPPPAKASCRIIGHNRPLTRSYVQLLDRAAWGRSLAGLHRTVEQWPPQSLGATSLPPARHSVRYPLSREPLALPAPGDATLLLPLTVLSNMCPDEECCIACLVLVHGAPWGR